MMKLFGLILISAICLINAQENVEFPIRAFAWINGKVHDPVLKKGVHINGVIRFVQETETSPVVLSLNITSSPRENNVFNENKVGSHFHKFGVMMSDISGKAKDVCMSCGPHFNPKSAIPPENIESGELGNFVFQPKEGAVVEELTIPKIKLFGPESMIGRSFVFHERPDDIITQADARKIKKPLKNATVPKPIPRIACGTISFEKF